MLRHTCRGYVANKVVRREGDDMRYLVWMRYKQMPDYWVSALHMPLTPTSRPYYFLDLASAARAASWLAENGDLLGVEITSLIATESCQAGLRPA